MQDLSFEIAPGEICVLIGPSGCGKTTALKMVNRLIAMTSGDITIDGRSVGELQLTQMSTVDSVNKLLTTPAIIAMNKAVAIDHQQPATVAAAFLKANHVS